MALVQGERTCRSGAGFNMRDDDVTLVRVQINPSRPASAADPPAMSITLPATDDATAAAQKYSTQEFSFNPNQEPPPRQQVPASPEPNRSAATEDNYSKAKSKSPGILPLLLIAIVAIVVVGGTAFFAGRLSNGPDKPPAIKLPVEKPAADPKQQTSPGTKPASDHPGGKTSAKNEKKKPVKTGKEPPPQHKQDIKDSDLPTSLKGLKDPDDIVHKSTDEAKAKDPAKAPRGGKDGDVIVESGEGIDVTTGSPSKKHRKTEGTDKRTAPQLRPDDEHESKPEPKLFNKNH